MQELNNSKKKLTITINGHQLNETQAIAVRIALDNFGYELDVSYEDQPYWSVIKELQKMMN